MAKMINTVERETKIRVFLKPTGGFTKGITDDQKKETTKLLSEVGRKPEDGWDDSIVIGHMKAASKPHQPTVESLDKRVTALEQKK